jgi:hypothetical protein
MRNNLIFRLILTAVVIVALLYGEYHWIINNMQPYYADGYVYIDVMNQTYMFNGDMEE